MPRNNMDKITVRRDGDRFVITDEESGVTTQGDSKIEALLMLADALTACEESDANLLAMARDVFVPDSSVRANEDPSSMKTDRERLHLRSEFSHTLAANGFPNIHVLTKERLQTLAHPISQELLSLLEDGEKTLVELADSLDLSTEEALSYVQEFATMAIVDIEEEGDDTVIRLSANYVVIEPLAAVPDVNVPEPPTEPAPPGVLEGIEDIAEGRTMSSDDLDDVLKKPLEAEGNEPIRCPVCGDEIPAFELTTDHAHSKELLKIILELLNELGHDHR